MALILSLEEAVNARLNECMNSVALRLQRSVRPIYASIDGARPELLGSCTLVHVTGRNYVVTAAHIVDRVNTHALYVAGTVGTQPVQILGQVHSTKEPSGGRIDDKLDLAFWEAPAESAGKLGNVNFLSREHFANASSQTEGRVFMAIGYPLSRNKKKINLVDKTIKTALWKYGGTVGTKTELAQELGVSGTEHLFLNYEKYSQSPEGHRVSSVNPQGLSGGPLVDIGNFSSIATYHVEQCHMSISGIIIERNTKHKVIIAVKFQKVLEAIKQNQSTP